MHVVNSFEVAPLKEDFVCSTYFMRSGVGVVARLFITKFSRKVESKQKLLSFKTTAFHSKANKAEKRAVWIRIEENILPSERLAHSTLSGSVTLQGSSLKNVTFLRWYDAYHWSLNNVSYTATHNYLAIKIFVSSCMKIGVFFNIHFLQYVIYIHKVPFTKQQLNFVIKIGLLSEHMIRIRSSIRITDWELMWMLYCLWNDGSSSSMPSCYMLW